MNIISILTGFILIFSCGHSPSKATAPFSIGKVIQERQQIEINIDSIVVKYWKSTEANEYSYRYNNKSLRIKGQYFGLNTKTSNPTTINKFINYINSFYIDKTERIILKKIKQPMMVTDYPIITVAGYKGGKQIFKEHTQIGSEDYEIKFNPKFLNFYKFLDHLTTLK